VPPADLAALIRATATDVLSGHGLDPGVLPERVDLRFPPDPEHGDYATSLALRSAGDLGVPPLRLAGWLAEALTGRAGVATAVAAAPGFVNLRLTAEARGATVAAVLEQGPRYGRTERRKETGAAPELDAARYAQARGRHGPPPDLAARTDDNPLYLVQHAHAQLCAAARHAADLGVRRGTGYRLLEHPAEGALIRALAEFPDVVRTAADLREPHRVTSYLESLATTCHRFYDRCRMLPMGDEMTTERHRARVALGEAARQVLANGLSLLGVSAPERM
jgi:arginyl-tRNA synthetase